MNAILEKVFELHRLVLSIMFTVLVGGCLSYIYIPKEGAPNIDIPLLYISAVQQAISPEDSRLLIVRPLESKFRGLEGLKKIHSTASLGHAGLLLEFELNFDKSATLDDVRSAIEKAKAELPAATKIQIIEVNLSQVPTIQVVLSGNVPKRFLYQKAEALRTEISSLSSVLDAKIAGTRDEVLEILVDEARLASIGISHGEILGAIEKNNRMVPAGVLENDYLRFNLKVSGVIAHAQDVMKIPLRSGDNASVTLGDIAEVRRTFEDPGYFTKFNGNEAITIEVIKRNGQNVITNNKMVRETVEKFTKDWPEQIKVDFILDKSTDTFRMLKSIESSVFTAIIMVILVSIASMGLVSSLLSGFSIICSLMIGFLILEIFGMSLNMMIMFGLVLTVGMLVDASIVVTEYADWKIGSGFSRPEAYRRATKRMLMPVLSSTATTLAAFLPMLLWPGVPGKFMSYLPIMVIIIMSASFITALFFIPVLGSLLNATALLWICSSILAGFSLSFYYAGYKILSVLFFLLSLFCFQFIYRNREWINLEYLRILPSSETQKTPSDSESVLHFDSEKITNFMGHYIRTLSAVVQRPLLTLSIIIGLMVSITIASVFVKPPHTEFFVEEEPETVLLIVSSPGNFSTSQAYRLVEEVEQEILAIDGIKSVFMRAGSKLDQSQNNEKTFVNQAIGIFTIEFEDYCCRRKANLIFEEIRHRTKDLPGIKLELRKIAEGPPSKKAIELDILGDNYRNVDEVTVRVRRYFEQLHALKDIQDSSSSQSIEWEIMINRDLANQFNLDVGTVGAAVQLVTEGFLIGKYRPDDSEKEIDIRLRIPAEYRSIDQIKSLQIQTLQGGIPLSNFVNPTPRREIRSINQKYSKIHMSISADIEKGFSHEEVLKEILDWLKTESWPKDVTFSFGESDADEENSKVFLAKALIMALAIMAIILMAQFNSFYQTILTLSTICMSFVGVMLGLFVTGQNLSIIMTGTGMVALAGIVVNNAIILIDTYNDMRTTYGLDPLKAVLISATQRMRPILITTGTTVLGLIPMALQINLNLMSHELILSDTKSIWWVPFSTAVIWGLLFSTLLTLVFIPTMLFAPFVLKERFRALSSKIKRDSDIRRARW